MKIINKFRKYKKVLYSSKLLLAVLTIISIILNNSIKSYANGTEEKIQNLVDSHIDVVNKDDFNKLYDAENIANIQNVVDKKIFTPNMSGNYRWNEFITRGEYLTALYKTVCIIDDYGNLNDEEIEVKRTEMIEDIKNMDYKEINYMDLNNHWSKNTVVWIKNYVEEKWPGYFGKIFPEGIFNPDTLITKGELCEITVPFVTSTITQITQGKHENIKDLNKGDEFYFIAMSLLQNNILELDNEEYFNRYKFITRYDAAIILNNLLNDMNNRKSFFESTNIMLDNSLNTAMQMYKQGEKNRYIFEYLINEYNKNKAMLKKNEELENNYIWALKNLILCGL